MKCEICSHKADFINSIRRDDQQRQKHHERDHEQDQRLPLVFPGQVVDQRGDHVGPHQRETPEPKDLVHWNISVQDCLGQGKAWCKQNREPSCGSHNRRFQPQFQKQRIYDHSAPDSEHSGQSSGYNWEQTEFNGRFWRDPVIVFVELVVEFHLYGVFSIEALDQDLDEEEVYAKR